MKQRIYIDTSVVGGFFDEEFAAATQALFERLEKGYATLEIRNPKDLIHYGND
jgi:hypothetical protein